MKGLAFRKLGRPSGHRRALLRNLVTSLIQHERISTTYAKAKEAQRVAEKIITKAKRALTQGRIQQEIQATDFVFDRTTTAPLLRDLAQRYIDRPGGYTRIHLHGNRQGDNAPRALLELVDQPRGDMKLELTAMTIGRETFMRAHNAGPGALQEEAMSLGSIPIEKDERFEHLTRVNAEKVVKFGGEEARAMMIEKAREHFFRMMAMRQLDGDYRLNEPRIKSLKMNKPRGNSSAFTPPMHGAKRLAGMRRDLLKTGPEEPVPKRTGGRNSVVRIGKGAFAHRQSRRVYIPPSLQMAAERQFDAEVAPDKFI